MGITSLSFFFLFFSSCHLNALYLSTVLWFSPFCTSSVAATHISIEARTLTDAFYILVSTFAQWHSLTHSLRQRRQHQLALPKMCEPLNWVYLGMGRAPLGHSRINTPFNIIYWPNGLDHLFLVNLSTYFSERNRRDEIDRWRKKKKHERKRICSANKPKKGQININQCDKIRFLMGRICNKIRGWSKMATNAGHKIEWNERHLFIIVEHRQNGAA